MLLYFWLFFCTQSLRILFLIRVHFSRYDFFFSTNEYSIKFEFVAKWPVVKRGKKHNIFAANELCSREYCRSRPPRACAETRMCHTCRPCQTYGPELHQGWQSDRDRDRSLGTRRSQCSSMSFVARNICKIEIIDYENLS